MKTIRLLRVFISTLFRLGGETWLFRFENLCKLAAEKDPGFSLDIILEMVSSFDRFRQREFDMEDSEFDSLRRHVDDWRKLILTLISKKIILFRELQRLKSTSSPTNQLKFLIL